MINSLLIFSTSVYNTVQIKLISQESNTFCNCYDYAFLRRCNSVNVTHLIHPIYVLFCVGVVLNFAEKFEYRGKF